ncbi:DUF413 domain-containing protein [Motiliproteus sp.]|uniref:DUF413 domain-containing protein n=1 Tax=Motiliproteus sp. TaxID=1898955 RepID=UPI003BAC4CEA
MSSHSTESFTTSTRFYDTEHFPYGIDRSGEFTVKQASLLMERGVAYQELAGGKRRPQSAMENDFVLFCQGQKEAESEDEKLWQRYLKVINKPNYYLGVGLSANSSSSSSDFDSD